MSGAENLTVEQMEARLASRTGSDEAFRSELVNHPRRTLESEFNIKIRPAYDVKVTLDASNRPRVVVARRENSTELSDADLESVAGGALTWPLPPDWP
ncbi:MAG: hypothetical protein KIT09_08240 [Bryobacteraceae bacterium]|nr:hypothetical protein [Bryobacteraceae bacterium]